MNSPSPRLPVQFLFLVIVVIAGCRTEQTLVTPDPHLERMLDQEKVVAYGSDPLLPKGMTMQRPPDGTLPANAVAGQPVVATGAIDGRYAERIPIHVDRSVVERGRHNFETFCAACHGVLGDSVSVVADRMALRRPENLHEPRVRAYPPGRLFQTIRQGYGLMPSYAVELSVEDSWGVVAYVRALQLARGARVAELPADIRAELVKEAR